MWTLIIQQQFEYLKRLTKMKIIFLNTSIF